jgi:hypothetical protein
MTKLLKKAFERGSALPEEKSKKKAIPMARNRCA